MDVNAFSPSHRLDAGFTLIEVMITLSVALILLAIGVPSYRTLAARNQQTGEINQFLRHLHLARSVAITHGVAAVLCPTLDRMNCLDEPNWHDGFMLYLDSNDNSTPDPAEERIRYCAPANEIGISMTSSIGRKRIIYRSDGRSSGSNLTLTFCHPAELIPPRAVILSNTGRPRVSDTLSDGSPLACLP